MQIPKPALYWLRYIFKSLSQRIKKVSARNEAKLVLARSWYADHMVIAHSWVHQHIVESAAAAWTAAPKLPAPAGPVDSNKRIKRDQAHSASSATGPAAEVPFITKDNVTVQIPVLIARWIRPNMTQQQAEKMTRDYEKDGQYNGAFKTFFSRICKNCFLAGRGNYAHKLNECQKLGNPCSLVCPKCLTGKHWTME